MFLTGLLLLRQAQVAERASRYVYPDGTSTTLSSLTWRGAYYADSNGQAIDIFNFTADVTVVDCRFEQVNNPYKQGGTVYWQMATINLTRCVFWQCKAGGNGNGDPGYGGILVSWKGPASVVVDDCEFQDCHAWAPGGTIYLDYEAGTENDVSITNSRFVSCQVGNIQTGARFGPQITCREVKEFTFQDNVFEWDPVDSGHVRSTALLCLAFAASVPEPNVVIDTLTVANTTFTEGLILLETRAKSLTYRSFSFRKAVCGSDTVEAGLLPKREFDDFTMIDCQFTDDCSSRTGFVDTSVANIKTVKLENCRFSECKSGKSTGFLYFKTNTRVNVTGCIFGNIRFWDEENENTVPYHLVGTEGCGTVTMDEIAFSLPQLSFWNMDLFFSEGYVELRRCQFVVNGQLSVSQIVAENYRHVTIDTCAFQVDGKNSKAPMIGLKGVQESQVEFYNCCFTHNAESPDEPTDGALYVKLEGSGKASFSSACFDTTKERSVVVTGIEATFDHEELMFGDCSCAVFDFPSITVESLVTEEPVVPAPTRDDSSTTVSAGLITGVFFGLLILIIILALLILFLLWRRRRREKSTTEALPPPEEPEETITSINEGIEGDAIDGATNDNPLFAVELPTNDFFNNDFEEKSFFLKDN